MNSDSTFTDTLNFANFIRNVHGDAVENMGNLSATSQTYSATSPMTSTPSLLMTVKNKVRPYMNFNTILKFTLCVLVIYVAYKYLTSKSFKKTCISRYGKCLSSRIIHGDYDDHTPKPSKPKKSTKLELTKSKSTKSNSTKSESTASPSVSKYF